MMSGRSWPECFCIIKKYSTYVGYFLLQDNAYRPPHFGFQRPPTPYLGNPRFPTRRGARLLPTRGPLPQWAIFSLKNLRFRAEIFNLIVWPTAEPCEPC